MPRTSRSRSTKPPIALSPRSLYLAFGVLIGVLLLSGALAYRHTLQIRHATDSAAVTHELLMAMQATLQHVTEAETGQRGYLITGDEGYLNPYSGAIDRVEQDLRDLEGLAGGDPELQAQVQALKPLVDAKLEELRQAIAMERTDPAAARKMVLTHLGRNLMDSIRARMGEMTRLEQDRRARRLQEAMRDYRIALHSGILATLLGLATAVGFLLQLRRHLRERAEQELALERQRQWLQVTLRSIGDALIATDEAGAVSFMNPVAEALTGWSAGEAAGRPLEEVFVIVNEDTRRPAADPVARVLTEGAVVGLANHTALVGRNGRETPIEDSAAPIRDASGRVAGVVLVFHDVTEKRRAEAELQKVHRALTARTRSSLALLHSEQMDEEVYLEEICAIITRDCGHAMVWMGFKEDGPARGVRIAAHAGFEEGYLENLRLTWADDERGRGPTGTAIRTGRPCGCRDTWTDPAFAPWRAEAVKRGYRSTLALPLLAGGEAFGAVTLYSRVPDGFSPGEVALLEDLVADLAYGITTHRLRRHHALAEAALRESESRFRTAFDEGPVPMAMSGLDGRFLRVNPAFAQMLGYSPEELEKRTAWTVTHPDDLESTRTGLSGLARGGSGFRLEKRYLRKDGTVIWGDMSTAVVSDSQSQPLYLLTHIQDITERKRVEEALREANRRKDEFLGTLAHELRNPLAPIRTGAYLLGARPAPDPETRQIHDMIARQAANMARLVDDLLQVSRIEQGKLELRKERVDLGRLLTQALEACQPAVAARGHRLDLALPDPAPALEADPIRLEQMVTNLVHNACKCTPPGGHIQVWAARDGAEVVLGVRDDGVGIAPGVIEHIFDLFYQAGGAKDQEGGGLGIGLTLVQRLAQLHGGSVTAASEGPGKGSEFLLRLPAAEPAAPAPAPAGTASQAPSGHRLRVLVIDDDPGVRTTTAMLLRAQDFEVSTAATGEKGIAEALARRPDIALIDLGMPDLDGCQVAARIRAELGRDIYLVALTGFSREEDLTRTQAAGFDRHLVKSGDPLELLQLLSEVHAHPVRA